MADVRTLLAAVLGVGLGIVVLAAPDAAVRVHTAGRTPTGRGGEYGRDDSLSDRGRLLVRLVGAGLLLAGLYFGSVAAGVP